MRRNRHHFGGKAQRLRRYEGYGAQRIATYLNNAGYRARSGKCWHPGSLRGMVGNLTYMGVLRCGDARSELMPELQIIPQEEFEAAQRIREDRSAHAAEEAEHHVPLRTRGQALLSNNVYCGHCGARLALTTSRKWRKLPDGTLDDTLRIRYTCYGKLRKQTECTGQTGYTMHILDEIIDKMVREIFSRLRGIPKEQLIISRYAKETAERKNHLQALQAERDKAEKDLLALKAEILAVIKGESAFPKDTLAEMIAAQEKKHTELVSLCEEASAELDKNAELMANVSQLYEELISYNHSQKLLSFRYNIDTNRVEARFTDGSAVANRMPNCLRTSSTRYFTVGLTRRIECHRFFMATAENHCNVFCVTNWSSE